MARRTIPAGVEVYEVNGPLFFGAADKIKDVLHFVAKKPRVFILRMRNVPAIDASGIRVLDDLFRSFSHQGILFVISGIQPQPREALERAGKLDEYGRENFVATLDEALAAARARMASAGGDKRPARGGDVIEIARVEGWDGVGVVTRRDAESGATILIALHSETLGPVDRRHAHGGLPGHGRGPARRPAARRGDDVQVGRRGISARRRQGRSRGSGGPGRRRAPGPAAPLRLPDPGARRAILDGRRRRAPPREDMDVIAETGAPYVFSRTPAHGGAGGSGSWTAMGVFAAVETVCREALGRARPSQGAASSSRGPAASADRSSRGFSRRARSSPSATWPRQRSSAGSERGLASVPPGRGLRNAVRPVRALRARRRA